MKKITIFITSLLLLILYLSCNENTTGPDSGAASLVVQGKIIPGGEIVLSGILDSQAEELSRHYQTWFDMQPVATREEWVRLTGTRRP